MADLGDNKPDTSIEYQELRELLDEVHDSKRAVDEKQGSYRAKLKQIIEDREWHKGAFGVVKKIDVMSETERADFLRTFDALYQIMMTGKWQAESKDLLSGLDEDEEDEEGESDATGEKAPSPSAIWRMSEEKVGDVVFQYDLSVDRADYDSVKAYKTAVVNALHPQKAAA